MTLKQRAYRVTLRRKEIDTVFYTGNETGREDREAEVRRGLVEHDGYNPAIRVREER
jgi:hypothetical protein